MRLLENEITKRGKVINNEVLNVDRFFSQQVNTELLIEIGKEFEHHFGSKKIDRILTVEASGIAIAMAAASFLHVPFVFARKNPDPLMEGDSFIVSCHSHSKEQDYSLFVLKDLLPAGENILIMDDFLSNGNEIMNLTNIVKQAGSKVIGIGVAIEKAFRPGRQRLEEAGYPVVSLARIEKFENGKPVFVKTPKKFGSNIGSSD